MRKIGLLMVGALERHGARRRSVSRSRHAHSSSTCTGTLASGTYHKLVVPAGATCDGTQANINVRGGVRVGEGATFILGADPSEGGLTDTGKIRGGIRANAPGLAAGALRPRQRRREDARRQRLLLDRRGQRHPRRRDDQRLLRILARLHPQQVHGTVKLTNNVMDDPDANEFVTNTIKGVCLP